MDIDEEEFQRRLFNTLWKDLGLTYEQFKEKAEFIDQAEDRKVAPEK